MTNVTSTTAMFANANLSNENYDALLTNWDAQALQSSLSLHAGVDTTYCLGENSRNNMIASDNWAIVDGGRDCTSHSLAAALEDSASTGGLNNADGNAITVIQLLDINGLLHVNAGSESAYQTAIASETDFSNPPTVAQVQSLINAVNDASQFVLTVDATFADVTPAGSYQLPVPNFNYQISWEEVGNEASNNSGGAIHITSANHTVVFGSPGVYRIAIDPFGVQTGVNDFDQFRVNNAGDKSKLLDVEQWGTTQWSSMANAFQGADQLTGPTASDIPDFSDVTSMGSMFGGATLAQPNTFAWDTSNVTSMWGMFSGAENANPDTSLWDTSSVTSMHGMFGNTQQANPDTSIWDTSSVTDMYSMFYNATSANPDTSGWNTESVTNMRRMFNGATVANPDTSVWDMSSVTNIAEMFRLAIAANPDTSSWDTSAVTDMSYTFASATAANPDTSGWNTSSVVAMTAMFSTTDVANPDVSGWDISSVNNMSAMFNGAQSADPDTSSWNTSQVTDMANVFRDAPVASPDTSGWDTSTVTNMESMFHNAAAANPDTSNWDTSSVTQMGSMFNGAAAFTGTVAHFDVSSLTNASNMFSGLAYGADEYDALLNAWSAQAVQSNVVFAAGNSIYCDSEAARDNLVINAGWVITDGGRSCSTVNLAEILEDSASTGGSNNGNGIPITATQLTDIEGIINVNDDSELAYQEALAAETNFSNPPTVAEVQTIINAVNAPNHYVIVVDATIDDASPVAQYTIPSNNVNYQIQWEEVGNETGNNSGGYLAVTAPNYTIDFGESGNYRVMIDPIGAASGSNDFDHFAVGDAGDKSKLIGVSQWGLTQWAATNGMFHGAVNLVDFTATDIPDLSQVTDMLGMFANAVQADPDVSDWDISSVTRLTGMFQGAIGANPDVSSWNTSSVVAMNTMFWGAVSASSRGLSAQILMLAHGIHH